MSYTSTYKTFLMKGTGTGTITWAKLVDIVDYPDLGAARELLDTTTLSDPMRTNIFGIAGNNDGLSFTANYTPESYQALTALADTETQFAVWFGGTESDGEVSPTGSEGKFEFKGLLDVSITGKGVNEVRQMQVLIAPTTMITESFS